jgi:uncharacterized repeat protein (TIGR01451 family)
MRALLILLAFLVSTPAFAANRVSLDSSVFVEKTVADAHGRNRVILVEPHLVTPGDRLVFILAYRNTGGTPASDFVVTNPLPQAVAYEGTADKTAQVSVDGGRNWGALALLKVKDADGRVRGARSQDVTHVRWAMRQPIPAGAQGRLSFRGIVR